MIAVAAFVGVAALVIGVATLLRDRPASRIEDRLDLLTGANTPSAAREGLLKPQSVLAQPLDAVPGFLEQLARRVGNINLSLFLEQADTSLTPSRWMVVSLILAGGGAAISLTTRLHLLLLPVIAVLMACLPLVWLVLRRRKRLKAFAVQLPDALEMLSRALRAGQSLASGCNMVANELPAPLGREFGRVFEEQNLGVSLDESLESLTERVPNLDLKFFATAVVLQRQTGGDLAEILDKIARLVRERFQIWGQVQALTGEGRLSGAVLLGLPVVLFLAVYKLNPDYVMVLFTDPMGKQMLAAAVLLQVVGAMVIRKIVNIRV
jgi:tight adherence protein B